MICRLVYQVISSCRNQFFYHNVTGMCVWHLRTRRGTQLLGTYMNIHDVLDSSRIWLVTEACNLRVYLTASLVT